LPDVRWRHLLDGIRRIVYALPASSLYGLTEAGSPSLHLPCRELLARASQATEIHGPLLEEEALQPHLGFWSSNPH